MNKEIFFIWTQGENKIPDKMKKNIKIDKQKN